MSYILDALRRAESERERGSVPTLHTSAVPVGTSDDVGAGHGWRPWAWGGAALVLLLLLWFLISPWWSRDARDARDARDVVVVASPAPSPAPAPQPAIAPTPPTPVPPPATVQIDPTAISPPVSPVRPPTPVAAVPRIPVPAADAPVPAASQLPEDIRRELPALTIGGAMYSDTPANRMLILNGQVFHEGDKVAANLVLEQIKLKGAVLAFKGHRYTVAY